MTHLIDKPGLYQTTREQYDEDPVVEPSLSCSIAKLLFHKSPAHAWRAHPRLNPDHEPEDARKFDLGSAAHALMLGEADRVVTIKAENYKTKAAQEARDEAIDAGKLPLLEHMHDQVLDMVASARRQLKRCEEGQGVFDPAIGVAEQTIVWREGERPDLDAASRAAAPAIWCRARPDWLPRGGGNICWDYKTTGESANPERWVRTMYNTEGDMQPAFYLRGLEAITGKAWHWRWVVQETEPPYALSICAPSAPMLELGAVKVTRAMRLWHWCLSKNAWPGYSRDTAYLEVVPWEDRQMFDRLQREAIAKEIGPELIERAIALYAPDDWKKDKAA